MSDLNNLSIGGRLTRDPELRHTQSGTPVCKFSIASNGWKDDDVCFVDCTAWGKSAEALHKHVKKGDPVIVAGKLELERWEKDGAKHQRHSINVRDWHFASAPKRGDQPATQPADGWGGGDGFAKDETPF